MRQPLSFFEKECNLCEFGAKIGIISQFCNFFALFFFISNLFIIFAETKVSELWMIFILCLKRTSN